MAKPEIAVNGPSTQWQLGAAEAEAYERYMAPRLFQPWALDLVNRAAPCHGERVLDLACGTGVVAARAAERTGSDGTLYAVDLNPRMIEIARARLGPLDAPVICRIGNAEQLPLPDKAVDVVLCQQGLQFFTDAVQAAREMARVLCPSGRAVVSVWSESAKNPWSEALISALKKHGQAALAAGLEKPFSMAGAMAAEALDRAGFGHIEAETVRIEINVPDPAEFFGGVLQALPGSSASSLSQDALAGIARAATGMLADYRRSTGYRIPTEATVVTASHSPRSTSRGF